MVPIVFIVVIILCARYFGVIAGILGSVLGTALFALFLFEPYGSFRVHDHQALSNLGLLLFAGIALSYANSDRADDSNSRQGRLKPIDSSNLPPR
jgi:K+-sensing histidine kinase KdpD